jgi:hypothetical protein
MKVHVPATLVMILIGSCDLWEHRPLSGEIVRRARAAGLDGASVLHGVEGFGASGLIHTTKVFSLVNEHPIAILIIDAEDKVRSFLPVLDDLIPEGVVTVQPCEFIRHYKTPTKVYDGAQ